LIYVKNNGDAVAAALAGVLKHGQSIRLSDSKSVGANRAFREVSNFVLTIENPASRLLDPLFSRFQLAIAVARFTWFMAGNNRLEDIAYYDPGVRRFSDDGFTVPGSDFGRRLIAPRSDLNQLENVISLLRRDPCTRRAVVAIYQPEDCGRDSRDIPCVLGLSFQIREGSLRTTVLMRSNNAVVLLPFNLFEFSMLAEIVACEIDIPLGALTYVALSMHVYEDNLLEATETIDRCTTHTVRSSSMGEMRDGSAPLQQIATLCELEARLRGFALKQDSAGMHDLIELFDNRLSAFWRSFAYVLVWFSASRIGDPLMKQAALNNLPCAWRLHLQTRSPTTKLRG
jgi:hypothetical protein